MQDQDKKHDYLITTNKDGKITGIQGFSTFFEQCGEYVKGLNDYLVDSNLGLASRLSFKSLNNTSIIFEKEIKELQVKIDRHEDEPSGLTLEQKQKLLHNLREKSPEHVQLSLEDLKKLEDETNLLKKSIKEAGNLKNIYQTFLDNRDENQEHEIADKISMNKIIKDKKIKLENEKRSWSEYLFGYVAYNIFYNSSSMKQELEISKIDHQNIKKSIEDAELASMPNIADQSSEDSYKAEDPDKYKNLFDRLAK